MHTIRKEMVSSHDSAQSKSMQAKIPHHALICTRADLLNWLQICICRTILTLSNIYAAVQRPLHHMKTYNPTHSTEFLGINM